jgi:hypothetical protein
MFSFLTTSAGRIDTGRPNMATASTMTCDYRSTVITSPSTVPPRRCHGSNSASLAFISHPILWIMMSNIFSPTTKISGPLGFLEERLPAVSGLFTSFIRPLFAVVVVVTLFIRVSSIAASSGLPSLASTAFFTSGLLLCVVALHNDFKAAIGIIRKESKIECDFFPVSGSPQHISIAFGTVYCILLLAWCAVDGHIDLGDFIPAQLCIYICNTTAAI